MASSTSNESTKALAEELKQLQKLIKANQKAIIELDKLGLKNLLQNLKDNTKAAAAQLKQVTKIKDIFTDITASAQTATDKIGAFTKALETSNTPAQNLKNELQNLPESVTLELKVNDANVQDKMQELKNQNLTIAAKIDVDDKEFKRTEKKIKKLTADQGKAQKSQDTKTEDDKANLATKTLKGMSKNAKLIMGETSPLGNAVEYMKSNSKLFQNIGHSAKAATVGVEGLTKVQGGLQLAFIALAGVIKAFKFNAIQNEIRGLQESFSNFDASSLKQIETIQLDSGIGREFDVLLNGMKSAIGSVFDFLTDGGKLVADLMHSINGFFGFDSIAIVDEANLQALQKAKDDLNAIINDTYLIDVQINANVPRETFAGLQAEINQVQEQAKAIQLLPDNERDQEKLAQLQAELKHLTADAHGFQKALTVPEVKFKALEIDVNNLTKTFGELGNATNYNYLELEKQGKINEQAKESFIRLTNAANSQNLSLQDYINTQTANITATINQENAKKSLERSNSLQALKNELVALQQATGGAIANTLATYSLADAKTALAVAEQIAAGASIAEANAYAKEAVELQAQIENIREALNKAIDAGKQVPNVVAESFAAGKTAVSEFAKELENVNKKLIEAELLAKGNTKTEIELILKGFDEQQINQIMQVNKQIDQLANQEKVKQELQKLALELANLGLTSEQLKINELAALGATSEQIAEFKQLLSDISKENLKISVEKKDLEEVQAIVNESNKEQAQSLKNQLKHYEDLKELVRSRYDDELQANEAIAAIQAKADKATQDAQVAGQKAQTAYLNTVKNSLTEISGKVDEVDQAWSRSGNTMQKIIKTLELYNVLTTQLGALNQASSNQTNSNFASVIMQAMQGTSGNDNAMLDTLNKIASSTQATAVNTIKKTTDALGTAFGSFSFVG